MKIQDIIKSAIISKGEHTEMELTPQAAEKYSKAVMFSGEFKFSEDDWTNMNKLIQSNWESSQYLVMTQGFIAGHLREFRGQVLIALRK